jgi:hypothetical protein
MVIPVPTTKKFNSFITLFMNPKIKNESGTRRIEMLVLVKRQVSKGKRTIERMKCLTG